MECIICKVGAHILSGNVFEPRALDELFPDWKQMQKDGSGSLLYNKNIMSAVFVPASNFFSNLPTAGPPLETKVQEDKFLILTSQSSYGVPNPLLPKTLHNDNNYVISLSQLCR